MHKDSWPLFITEKLKSQLAIENARKIQTWAIALLGLFSMGAAINLLSAAPGKAFLLVTKILFLAIFHLVMALAVYLPDYLQRGEKVLSKTLGVRDLTSLIFMSLSLVFVAYIVFSLAYQVLTDGEEARAGFLTFVSWINVIVAGAYLGSVLFYLTGFKLFPKAAAKALEKVSNKPLAFLISHGVLFFVCLWGYSQVVELGTSTFFEQFRLAGLFWLTCVSVVLFVGRLLEESSIASLASLELEVASGKLERADDILLRLKQAFISKRLMVWVNRKHHVLSEKAHDIAQFLHESVSIVDQDHPSEAQLGMMEDRYRRAHQSCQKLDKNHETFLLNLSLLTLLDVEREKVDDLKDRFSKEIRHAKLELASVRKRIDEKLHALKDRDRQQTPEPQAPQPTAAV